MLVWVFFCAADMSVLPVVATAFVSSERIQQDYTIRYIVLVSSDGSSWKLTCSVEWARS